MIHAIDRLSAATATDKELVAAPGAGKSIDIYGFYASTNTATDILLEDGGTALHEGFLAADGGQILNPDRSEPLWSVGENTALTYTTGTAADLVVEVWYDIVAA